MRRVRYNVAASLDGYIADINDGFDWIPNDDAVDFAALFATLLNAGQVDAVEVTVVPVLLGGGIPLLAPTTGRSSLRLTHSHVYPTGMVALHYEVPGATA